MSHKFTLWCATVKKDSHSEEMNRVDYPKLLLEFKNERSRDPPAKREFNTWLRRKNIRELPVSIRARDIGSVTTYSEAKEYIEQAGCDMCKGSKSLVVVESIGQTQQRASGACPYCKEGGESDKLKFNCCLHAESGYTLA